MAAAAPKKPAVAYKGGPIPVHDDLVLAKEQEILTLLASQGTMLTGVGGEREPPWFGGGTWFNSRQYIAGTLELRVYIYTCIYLHAFYCVCFCVYTCYVELHSPQAKPPNKSTSLVWSSRHVVSNATHC
jgi:hypothetical protein